MKDVISAGGKVGQCFCSALRLMQHRDEHGAQTESRTESRRGPFMAPALASSQSNGREQQSPFHVASLLPVVPCLQVAIHCHAGLGMPNPPHGTSQVPALLSAAALPLNPALFFALLCRCPSFSKNEKWKGCFPVSLPPAALHGRSHPCIHHAVPAIAVPSLPLRRPDRTGGCVLPRALRLHASHGGKGPSYPFRQCGTSNDGRSCGACTLLLPCARVSTFHNHW